MLWGNLICLRWAADVYTCSAPLRWKQHEAYVQVLEAKYTELCCKWTSCIHHNMCPLTAITNISGCLWRDVSPDAFSLLPLFAVLANDVPGLKESEEKLKQQQQESARRENILVMRLATKEQEMQECTVRIYIYSSTLLKLLFWLWGACFLAR